MITTVLTKSLTFHICVMTLMGIMGMTMTPTMTVTMTPSMTVTMATMEGKYTYHVNQEP